MTRTSKLLSHGLFEKPFMDSRVQSRTLSKKEEILGHLVGPLGLIFVVNTIAALVEKFFTQQTGAIYGVENLDMVRVMGHQYEVVMTVTKILAVVWGIFVGWLIQHTQSTGALSALAPDLWLYYHRHRLPDFPVPRE